MAGIERARPARALAEGGEDRRSRDAIADTFGARAFEPYWFGLTGPELDELGGTVDVLSRARVEELARRFPEGRLAALYSFVEGHDDHVTVLTRIGDQVFVVDNAKPRSRVHKLVSLADFERNYAGTTLRYAMVETESRIPFPSRW